MTFVVGFVKFISYGSSVPPPWDQACHWPGCSPLGWGGPVKIVLETARLFHASFEQSFEKEGMCPGHWNVFNKRNFQNLRDGLKPSPWDPLSLLLPQDQAVPMQYQKWGCAPSSPRLDKGKDSRAGSWDRQLRQLTTS